MPHDLERAALERAGRNPKLRDDARAQPDLGPRWAQARLWELARTEPARARRLARDVLARRDPSEDEARIERLDDRTLALRKTLARRFDPRPVAQALARAVDAFDESLASLVRGAEESRDDFATRERATARALAGVIARSLADGRTLPGTLVPDTDDHPTREEACLDTLARMTGHLDDTLAHLDPDARTALAERFRTLFLATRPDVAEQQGSRTTWLAATGAMRAVFIELRDAWIDEQASDTPLDESVQNTLDRITRTGEHELAAVAGHERERLGEDLGRTDAICVLTGNTAPLALGGRAREEHDAAFEALLADAPLTLALTRAPAGDGRTPGHVLGKTPLARFLTERCQAKDEAHSRELREQLVENLVAVRTHPVTHALEVARVQDTRATCASAIHAIAEAGAGPRALAASAKIPDEAWTSAARAFPLDPGDGWPQPKPGRPVVFTVLESHAGETPPDAPHPDVAVQIAAATAYGPARTAWVGSEISQGWLTVHPNEKGPAPMNLIGLNALTLLEAHGIHADVFRGIPPLDRARWPDARINDRTPDVRGPRPFAPALSSVQKRLPADTDHLAPDGLDRHETRPPPRIGLVGTVDECARFVDLHARGNPRRSAVFAVTETTALAMRAKPANALQRALDRHYPGEGDAAGGARLPDRPHGARTWRPGADCLLIADHDALAGSDVLLIGEIDPHYHRHGNDAGKNTLMADHHRAIALDLERAWRDAAARETPPATLFVADANRRAHATAVTLASLGERHRAGHFTVDPHHGLRHAPGDGATPGPFANARAFNATVRPGGTPHERRTAAKRLAEAFQARLAHCLETPAPAADPDPTRAGADPTPIDRSATTKERTTARDDARAPESVVARMADRLAEVWQAPPPHPPRRAERGPER